MQLNSFHIWTYDCQVLIICLCLSSPHPLIIRVANRQILTPALLQRVHEMSMSLYWNKAAWYHSISSYCLSLKPHRKENMCSCIWDRWMSETPRSSRHNTVRSRYTKHTAAEAHSNTHLSHFSMKGRIKRGRWWVRRQRGRSLMWVDETMRVWDFCHTSIHNASRMH